MSQDNGGRINNWKKFSAEGVYLIGEPLRFALRRCELLFGDKKGRVRLMAGEGWATQELQIEELEGALLGRVSFKLLAPY